MDPSSPSESRHTFAVEAMLEDGETTTDEIRAIIGDTVMQKRAEHDQDNALAAWPKHGLPGTQPRPIKNGKKW